MSNSASDLTGGADFNLKLLQNYAATQRIASISVAPSVTETSYAFSESNTPNKTTWETGSWKVKVTVTTGSNDIYLSIKVTRVSSTGTVVQTQAASQNEEQCTLGVKTFTWASSLSWSTGSASDRLRVEYVFRNNVAQPRSCAIQTAVSGDVVITPLES